MALQNDKIDALVDRLLATNNLDLARAADYILHNHVQLDTYEDDDSHRDVLLNVFSWINSPQGYDYWKTLKNKINSTLELAKWDLVGDHPNDGSGISSLKLGSIEYEVDMIFDQESNKEVALKLIDILDEIDLKEESDQYLASKS